MDFLQTYGGAIALGLGVLFIVVAAIIAIMQKRKRRKKMLRL